MDQILRFHFQFLRLIYNINNFRIHNIRIELIFHSLFILQCYLFSPFFLDRIWKTECSFTFVQWCRRTHQSHFTFWVCFSLFFSSPFSQHAHMLLSFASPITWHEQMKQHFLFFTSIAISLLWSGTLSLSLSTFCFFLHGDIFNHCFPPMLFFFMSVGEVFIHSNNGIKECSRGLLKNQTF